MLSVSLKKVASAGNPTSLGELDWPVNLMIRTEVSAEGSPDRGAASGRSLDPFPDRESDEDDPQAREQDEDDDGDQEPHRDLGSLRSPARVGILVGLPEARRLVFSRIRIRS